MTGLRATGLSVRYGRAAAAVEAVDLAVAPGEILALLGSNGAGKTSLVHGLIGLVPATGRITLDRRDVTALGPEGRARAGLALVPEGRRVFPGLTVAENLDVACFASRVERAGRREAVYRLFPALAEKAAERGWRLSGGQQQMLAIGRALMAAPRVLLLDEPSLGLAPRLVAELMQRLRGIADTGTAVLLAEQNTAAALSVADRALVLAGGRVAASGPAAAFRDRAALESLILGEARWGEAKSGDTGRGDAGPAPP